MCLPPLGTRVLASSHPFKTSFRGTAPSRHAVPHNPSQAGFLLQPSCNLSLSLTCFVPWHPKYLTWSGGSVWKAQSPLDLTTVSVLPKMLLLAAWYPAEAEPELAAGSYCDVPLGLILSLQWVEPD